jgi:tetratricopeptide (TPR) repeat protein
VYYSIADYDSTLKDASKALSINPNDGRCLKTRSKALSMKGIFHKALKDIERALGIDGKDGEAKRMKEEVLGEIRREKDEGERAADDMLAMGKENDSESNVIVPKKRRKSKGKAKAKKGGEEVTLPSPPPPPATDADTDTDNDADIANSELNDNVPPMDFEFLRVAPNNPDDDTSSVLSTLTLVRKLA